jgi:hypothetical protein
MILATGFHLMRGEAKFTPLTLALGAIAAFIAWGRFHKLPIAARTTGAK